MKRAAFFVAFFVFLGACANDFDALTSGKSATEPPTKSDVGDDDNVSTDKQDCSAKQCEPTVSNDGEQSIVASGCCTYATFCKDPFSCTTECSGGAICESTCTNEGACSLRVTDAKAHYVCASTSCTMDCGPGGNCDLDCTQSSSCDVTCDGKSKCVVRNCGDNCDVTCLDGSPALSCGNKTRACGACS